MKNKNLFKYAIILGAAMFSLFSSVAYAQSSEVTGNVTDEAGNPLIGVFVSIPGANVTTSTDGTGSFTLRVPASAKVINFSFPGMDEIDVQVDGKSVYNVTMAESALYLDGEVAVGYDNMVKREISSSVSSVSGDKITQSASAFNVFGGLAGKVAGVNIVNGSGHPLGNFHIRVRGNGAINTSAEPLYVVDGMVDVDPSMINNNDIATVDVLKDAASTAIYGAKGANGVVIITTKSGQKGAGSVSFDTKTGVSMLTRTPAGMKDGADWLSKNALVTNNSLSFNKGDETTQIYAGIGYQNANGVIANSSAKRLSGVIKIKSQINKWLDIQAVAQGAKTNSLNSGWEGANSALVSIQKSNDYAPSTLLNGYNDETDNTNANFNVTAGVRFGDHLKLTVKGDYLFASGVVNKTAKTILGDIEPEAPYSVVDNGRTKRWANEDFLTYDNLWADGKLHSNFMLGVAAYSYAFESSSAGSHNQPTDFYSYHNIGLGTMYTPYSSASKSMMTSVYFRTNQVWDNKYMLGVTVRYDGSSIDGANKRTGIYPAVSAGWSVSEEPWFEDAKEAVDLFKIRLSYGLVGNSTYPLSETIIPFNDPLKYEKARQFDAGIDLSFAKGRILVTADFYMKNNSDLIQLREVLNSTDNNTIWSNVGEIKNSGFELTINTKNFDRPNFKWNTDIIFATNKCTAVNLGGDIITNDILRSEAGQPWQQFYIGGQYLGQAMPKGEISFVNTFDVKGFSLLFDFNSMFGNKIYTAGAENGGSLSQNYLSDASFIRLKTVALSYDFKRSVFRNSKFVKGIKFGVVAENALLFTKFAGFDPEAVTRMAEIPMGGLGLEWATYPKPMTVTGNLKITF